MYLCVACHFLEVSEPHLLDRYTPEVFRAYVVSRLESVSVVLRDGCDDPLEDLTVVNQQLDQVPYTYIGKLCLSFC